jgi:muramoyltetrapeptide carboxypeptidase LdcA involved in peptidoglycan recycling
LNRFKSDFRDDGVILFLENCELSPCAVARALWNMRFAGWFDGLKGILLGRSSGKDATLPSDLSYREAVESVLGSLEIPVILDADIGHQPPQMVLINGALAEVRCKAGKGSILQRLV